MIEALSVAVHAVARRPPSASDTVVVIGCGMIGLLIVQVLRQGGCGAIIAVDVESARRALAERLGASWTIDASSADVTAAVREATNGRGADLVLEAVGRTATIQTAVRSVRKGGTVTLVGNLTPEITLPLQDVVTRELSLLGSCASSGEYPACIDMLASGVIDVVPLISATAPLEDGPAWFDRLHRGDESLMKVVLQP